MSSSDNRHWVLNVIVHVSIFARIGRKSSAVLFSSDALSDGGLARPLAQLSDISTGEVFGQICAEVHVYIGCNGTLSQVRLEHAQSAALVWQRNIDELV